MRVTPDGARYLMIAQAERVPRPFHYRWLVPTFCGMSEKKWRAVQALSLIGLMPAGWWYGGEGWRGCFVALSVVGLAGVWKFNWAHPVLVDAPAMLFALLSTAAAQHGLWLLAIELALIAGAIKETSPVFAALWAWNPIVLVGLLAPAVRHLWRAGDDVCVGPAAEALTHPVRTSWEHHKVLPGWVWVLPWGMLLVGLAELDWTLAAVLAVAYAQCLVATDSVRLYQWAWPALAVATATAVDPKWWPVLLAVHLVNPFATDGV